MLNFFKCESISRRGKPQEIMRDYLKGNFLIDCIAVIPWSIIYPVCIFLRYLKLLIYNVYLKYFEDFIIENIFIYYLDNKQIKILMDIF